MKPTHRSRTLLVAVLLLSLAGAALADDPAPGWRDELTALMREGKYADAEIAARTVLFRVEAEKGTESVEAAEVIGILVESLWRGGKATDPGTKVLAERAVAIEEKALGPEDLGVASALNNLALVHRFAGDYAAARPLFERALAIREQLLGPEHPQVARSLSNLAYILMDLGDTVAARPLFERAIAIQEKALGPEHPETAKTIQNLANLLEDEGDFTAAGPLYERVLAIREKGLGPEHPEVAMTLANLAMHLEATGDYAAARLLYERSLAIKEKTLGPDHPSVARSLGSLGSLLRSTGDYVAARPLLERAVTIEEKALGPDHPDLASTLNQFANLLSDVGDHAAARILCERAVAIREKSLGPDHPDVARGMASLAGVFQEMDDIANERPLRERSLLILERALGPDHPDVAMGMNNLAGLLTYTGDHAAARPLYERALAIREKAFGQEHPSLAWTLGGFANLLEETRDYDAARPLLERSLAIREKALGPWHPLVANSLFLLGRVRAKQGQIADALDAAIKAEQVRREHLRLTNRSLPERQALKYAAVGASGLDLAMNLAARGLDAASRKRVLDALVRSRAVVLDEMAARHHSARTANSPQIAALAAVLSSARARLANLVVRGGEGQSPEIYRRLLDDAQSEKELAERALAVASADFARELSRGRLGIDEVVASLPTGSALVAFAQYPRIDLAPKSPANGAGAGQPAAEYVPSYLAFVQRSGETDPQVVDFGLAAPIDDLIAAWRREAGGGGSESAHAEVASRLRKVVWDPLRSALGESSRVFAVPDGSLNLVNLAAFPLDDGGYLIERGPLVHYLSAERDLVPSGDARVGEGLLALGAPNYDATSMYASVRKPGTSEPTLVASSSTYRGSRASCGSLSTAWFGPLPGTGKETREIVRLWEKHGPVGSSTPTPVLDLREAAAGEEALKRSAPGRRVLHLATHGFFLGGECTSALAATRGVTGLTGAKTSRIDAPPHIEGENPLLLSGLVLAGANHHSAAGPGEEDGILTAEEIASLDLSGVEWAVLSACETGVGDVLAGEGVFGLRRAFQVAGATTMIMSLWMVEDEATREWMKALYSGRLESHLDTAEAVRNAGLKVLRDRRKRGLSTHPFYWAAFVAAGGWR